MHCFTFSAAAGDDHRIRVAETSGTLVARVDVVRPDGTTVCGPSSQRRCQLDAAGTFRIVVGDNAGAGTGNYKLAIQRLNNPVGCTALAFGAAPVAGSAGPGEIDCFTFDGAAGDELLARVVHTSGTAIGFTLSGPSGDFVCSGTVQSQANFDCPLDANGTHTIVLESSFAGYRIGIQRLNDPG